MSCYNNCYLPIPPRAWSRVQNSCSLITDTQDDELVKVPYSNDLVPASLLGEKIAMLNKGNVLQYKANSSNLTKSQKYSKIAQGKWTNRNTTWATQSTRGYTNPNTSSLKRSGNVVNVAFDPITGAIIGPTTEPVTCIKPIVPINEGLPSNGGGGSINEPDIPPPVPPTPASDTFPPIIPDTPVEPVVVQDEGVLICSIQENICTGETTSTLSQQLCNPTSDSDVPGTIQLLCWNDGTPTWYPRQRYIMTNSTNKWPINATLSSAVRPFPPIITSISADTIIILNWTYETVCLPISRFDIYQDGIFIQSLPSDVFTANINITSCGTFSYFIIAVTNGSNISSEPSNTVSININSSSPPSSVTVNWASADFDDVIIDINMNFTPPLTIRCGTPDLYVVTVFDPELNIISEKTVPYVSGQSLYEVNFNDIRYAINGTVSVYLVSIDPNTGLHINGYSASSVFTSSSLPIYINSEINSDRTEVNFNVITQNPLRQIDGIFIPNNSTVPPSLSYYPWEANPIISQNIIVTVNSLTNNEYEYYIMIRPQLINLTNFPYPIAIVTANRTGIQRLII